MSYPSDERYHLKFTKSLGDQLPTQIDEDVWSIMSAHRPGKMRLPITLPNRSLIYKLHGDDGDFLVILNALVCDEAADQPFKALRDLAEKEGAPIRYILTPASSHNLCLTDYAKAFPDAKVVVPDGRIPRRRERDLMKLPNVAVFDLDDPLPELRALGLHVHVWGGIREGPLNSGPPKFPLNLLMPSHNEPVLERGEMQECIFFHEPSGSITNGGHHMWLRPPGEKMPLAMRPQAPKEGFNWGPVSGSSIADKAAFRATVDHLLAWKFDKIFDVHTPPNMLVRDGGHEIFETFFAGVLNDDWSGAPLDAEVYPNR